MGTRTDDSGARGAHGGFPGAGAVAALLLVLLFASGTAGCAAAPRLVDLPIALVSSDTLPLPGSPLEPEVICERTALACVYLEVPARGVKPPGEWAQDVATTFVSVLGNPFRVLSFVGEILFGWLDFSTTFGSGFVVSAEGYLVTNAHVVGSARVVYASRSDGVRGKARVVALDEARDLALVRLELPPGKILSPLEVLPLGESATLKLGQRVLAYGFPGRPWRQEGPPRPTVTQGIVSSLGIDAGEAAPRVQIDAAVNSGSSGGPVLDSFGRVVGVVTEAGDPTTFASQSFAIPIDDVQDAFFRVPAPGKDPASKRDRPAGEGAAAPPRARESHGEHRGGAGR